MKKYLIGAFFVGITFVSQGWFFHPPLPALAGTTSIASKSFFCKSQDARPDEVVLSPESARQVSGLITSLTTMAQENANFQHLRINGLPGTGKSLLALQLAKKLGFEYICCSTEGLACYTTEEAILQVSSLFDFARTYHKKVVIIIDDVIMDDSHCLFRPRDSKTTQRQALLLNHFLKYLSAEQNNFVVIAITGSWQSVDEEVLKHVSTKIEVGLPGLAERRALYVQEVQKAFGTLTKVLQSKQRTFFQRIFGVRHEEIQTPTNELSPRDFDELALLSEGLSGREISKIVHRAFSYALTPSEIIITKNLIVSALEKQRS